MGEGTLWPGLFLYTASYALRYKRFGSKSVAAYKAAFAGHLFFASELSRVRAAFETFEFLHEVSAFQCE